MTDAVRIEGDTATVRFDRYDLDAYRLFLATKSLPEQEVTFSWEEDAYTVTTPARFAPLLGVAVDRAEGARLPLPEHLFDYQRWAVDLALESKRFSLFLDTGLGKTAVYLEWARQVQAISRGRVLILAPLAVIPQVINEAARFYPPSHVYPDGAVCETFVITHLRSRDELIRWCKTGEEADHWTHQPTVFAICNYEKFIGGRIPELRHLAGVVADESSVLKTGGGVIKWNLIHSAKGIEYKLSCTATPAPNEPMEYASQAAFLEKLRNENDILWTWFKRNKYGEWVVPGHAKPHFYRFLASWSLYMRDPAAFGFGDILSTLPPPEVREERLPLTDEQRHLMTEILVTHKVGMFADNLPMRPRQKLMQLARGFLYEGTGKAKRIRRVDSAKARRVAEIVHDEVSAGHRVLVWTTFDEEAEVIADELATIGVSSVAVLSGKQSEDERLDILSWFRGKRCCCHDSTFRAKLPAWRTTGSTSARIVKSAGSDAGNTWPSTTESTPRSSAKLESSEIDTTPGAESNTPAILSSDDGPSKGLASTENATRTIDSPKDSRSTGSPSKSTERRRRRDASSACGPSTEPSAGESISITATRAADSGDSSARTATSDSDNSATIQTPLNAPPCTCGHLTGGRILITKAALLGYGLNLQFVTSMVFSGFDDSFERAYQAVRRAYRYGQTKPVRVWWPYVPELEGLVFGNIRTKEARFLEEVAAQEAEYRKALADQLKAVAA